VNKRLAPRANSSLPNAKALALAKGTGAKVQKKQEKKKVNIFGHGSQEAAGGGCG